VRVVALKVEEALAEADSCSECNVCLDVCPTFKASGDDVLSPPWRLRSAARILRSEELSERDVESMYSCTECYLCTSVCPYEIKTPEVVGAARAGLVKAGLAPLERGRKIINGILKLGNSVKGDPERRLDWLPDKYEEVDSDVLLYVGCLASYLVTDAARSTYQVLKAGGVKFRILRDEGCCGNYIYEAGMTDLAEEVFTRNVERFESEGIRRVILPCVGCYRCFKNYYPELVGKLPFTVEHVTQTIFNLVKAGKLGLKSISWRATYHDPCHLGRTEGIYDEPREVLKACGVEIIEMPEKREKAPCCGSGAGVRSLYRDLSLKMASNLFAQAPEKRIITPCPFCAFNMRYTAEKTGADKDIIYFTSVVAEAALNR